MNDMTSPQSTFRKTLTVIAFVLVIAVSGMLGVLAYHSASSSEPMLDAAQELTGGAGVSATSNVHIQVAPPERPEGSIPREALPPSIGDGVLPDGVSVFDDSYPSVAGLDPDLLGALRAAASDAANEGIAFTVTSGWRSPAYQNQLLQEAVVNYGSAEEAARWVATADTSAHVSGDAVDVGPMDAWSWLAEHGSGYGLCQVYDNEPWHFELRPEAVWQGCPVTYADPTKDPRMGS